MKGIFNTQKEDRFISIVPSDFWEETLLETPLKQMADDVKRNLEKLQQIKSIASKLNSLSSKEAGELKLLLKSKYGID